MEISVADYQRRRTEGWDHLVLDVREPWEVEICALPDSVAIPMARVPSDFTAPDRPVVVVCHHGVRSLHAVAWLRAQGVREAVSLRGGLDAWAREIDPAMARY